MEINKCPVCNNNLDHSICRHCGYTQIIWPEALPESISSFEKNRINTLREIQEKHSLKIRDIEDRRNVLETNLESLEDALFDARKRNERLTNERDELNEKNRSQSRKLESELQNLQRINNNLEAKLADSTDRLEKSRNLSEDLKEQNRELSSDLARVKSELEQLSRSPKAGNVYFILDDDGEFSVIPVPVKKHYFATGPGIESCHAPDDSISMLPVMTTAKVAFSVEKSLTGGYRLTDLAGTLTSSGAMKENKIRLTQGVSLKIRGGNFKLYFSINQN